MQLVDGQNGSDHRRGIDLFEHWLGTEGDELVAACSWQATVVPDAEEIPELPPEVASFDPSDEPLGTRREALRALATCVRAHRREFVVRLRPRTRYWNEVAQTVGTSFDRDQPIHILLASVDGWGVSRVDEATGLQWLFERRRIRRLRSRGVGDLRARSLQAVRDLIERDP